MRLPLFLSALYYVFLMFFLDNFKSDGVLRTMFYLRVMLSKVFGRSLRTMSLCIIAIYYV